MPEASRIRAFEPFFTTKGADHQHIGMGLAVAREVVNGHGGFIDIEAPAEGRSGCLVRVQFPVGG